MSSHSWPSVKSLRVPFSNVIKPSVAWPLFVTVLLALVACGDDSEWLTGPGPAASVSITPDSVTVVEGQAVQLTATVRDEVGTALIDATVTWSSSETNVAEVDSAGLVSGEGPGLSLITATCEGTADTATVTVTAIPVDTVEISPGTAWVPVGQKVQLTATVYDADDNELTGRVVAWSSSDTLVASVDSTGLVTGVAADMATITATSEGKSDSATVTVTPIPVESIEISPGTAWVPVGQKVQLTATVYDADDNELTGSVVSWSSLDTLVASVDSTGLVTGVAEDTATITATSESKSDSIDVMVMPAVPPSGPFTTATVGSGHFCAITDQGEAYCWGKNSFGELGGGFLGGSFWDAPVQVTGGHTFSTIIAGEDHTCALTPQGAAYCWGRNVLGALGNSDTTRTPEPVAVTGGLEFSQLEAGSDHTCGVTVNNDAYCWGYNYAGQVGANDTTQVHFTPTAVVGGLKFSGVSGGVYHTCGTTLGGAAYCWGRNSGGQLGDGTEESRSQPVPVIGGLTFAAVSVGGWHSCGLIPTGMAYCWGYMNLAPTPVTGGVQFLSLDGGGLSMSALGTDSLAYTSEFVFSPPTPVPGGLKFMTLSSGWPYTCGVTPLGGLYCWGGGFGSTPIRFGGPE